MSNIDVNKLTTDKPSLEIFSRSFNSLEFLALDNDYIESLGSTGRNARVTSCTFKSTTFNRCYFRGVIFTSCDFTSSRFIDCNFKEAKFIHCKFNYATFRRTIVESGEIIANLPYEPNVRRDLLRNLRVDARELGSVEEESLYIQHEIEASDLFCISAFWGRGEFYRKKYSAVERFGFLFQFLKSKVSGFVWGNGERPARLGLTCFVITLILGVALFWYGHHSQAFAVGGEELDNFLLSIRLAVMEFVGVPYVVGDYDLKVPLPISVIAVCFRYVVIGLLVSVMFRAFSRR
ncbi:pentapeptide repeat-containing protein [Pseudomonas viridiflava]|uniref:pentapeptide repeat-containing protein n=4 Tax=Pseudomonas viridiflava TaxID=33069 RepID=UPI000F0229EC|nr:pentapeptide repeat-containing protein [Pseudomonas viridiflava]